MIPIRALVEERSHMPCGVANNTKVSLKECLWILYAMGTFIRKQRPKIVKAENFYRVWWRVDSSGEMWQDKWEQAESNKLGETYKGPFILTPLGVSSSDLELGCSSPLAVGQAPLTWGSYELCLEKFRSPSSTCGFLSAFSLKYSTCQSVFWGNMFWTLSLHKEEQ